MTQAQSVVLDVMENAELTKPDRHQKISKVVLEIAEFTDQNSLYLDEEIAVHCVTTFMGAEDVLDIQDEVDRDETKKQILAAYVVAQKMIRADSGILEIEKLFKKVTKPEIDSPVVEYLRELKAERGRS